MYMSQAPSLVIVVVIGQDGGDSDRGGHGVCDGGGKMSHSQM